MDQDGDEIGHMIEDINQCIEGGLILIGGQDEVDLCDIYKRLSGTFKCAYQNNFVKVSGPYEILDNYELTLTSTNNIVKLE